MQNREIKAFQVKHKIASAPNTTSENAKLVDLFEVQGEAFYAPWVIRIQKVIGVPQTGVYDQVTQNALINYKLKNISKVNSTNTGFELSANARTDFPTWQAIVKEEEKQKTIKYAGFGVLSLIVGYGIYNLMD